MGMKCIEADVGGTSVKIGLFKITEEPLDKREVRIHKEKGGRCILPDVVQSIRDKMEEMGLSLKTDLAGIRLGVPGPVMLGGFVGVCMNLGWRRMNPQEGLSSLLDGVTVKSENDANVAALEEMWQDGGKGYKDLAMAALGTGVDGGIIIGEEIIAGRHSPGGEVGHIHVRNEEWGHRSCGGVDCMEQICSAAGIAREARGKMEVSDKPSVLREHGGNTTAKDVLDVAGVGDELTSEVMDMMRCYLGLTLSIAIMVVDPEIFVIGGGISKTGQFLIDAVQRYYDYFTPISRHKGKLGLVTLGNDAGVCGAARLVLQDWYCRDDQ